MAFQYVQYVDKGENRTKENRTKCRDVTREYLTTSTLPHTSHIQAFLGTLVQEHACMYHYLLNIQMVISLCVFQLHVRGAHRQGHNGKSATNIREL